MNEHLDAIGRPLKVGDVIVHISRGSSTIHTDEGVVVKLLPQGEIVWSRVDRNWDVNAHGFVYRMCSPRVIYRTDLCIIVDLTEEQLKEKYSIE